MPCHALHLRNLYAANFFKEMACEIFEYLKYVFLVGKRHFAVYLCELWLTVSAQVFIAETLGNLKIAIESTHHQELFQGLWTLWQSIELTGIHTAGHHEVTCAFRSTSNKYWSLNLYKVLIVEEVTNQDGHTVTQFKILSHNSTAQVKISVFHADIISTVSIIFNSEWRCKALAQHVELFGKNFNIASRHFSILRLALADFTRHLYAPFASHAVGLFAECGISRLIEYQLCDSVAVAQVNECHTAHLTCSLYPSGKCHFAAGISESKLTASFCSVHYLTLFILSFSLQRYE